VRNSKLVQLTYGHLNACIRLHGQAALGRQLEGCSQPVLPLTQAADMETQQSNSTEQTHLHLRSDRHLLQRRRRLGHRQQLALELLHCRQLLKTNEEWSRQLKGEGVVQGRGGGSVHERRGRELLSRSSDLFMLFASTNSVPITASEM